MTISVIKDLTRNSLFGLLIKTTCSFVIEQKNYDTEPDFVAKIDITGGVEWMDLYPQNCDVLHAQMLKGKTVF